MLKTWSGLSWQPKYDLYVHTNNLDLDLDTIQGQRKSETNQSTRESDTSQGMMVSEGVRVRESEALMMK